MDILRVRAYNVRFGDAILVSVPDRAPTGDTTLRHILIDVGNVLSGHGGDDAVFGPVIENVLDELGGKPVDLYVMTHEHLDHVQGLFYAANKLKREVPVNYAWLTASSEEGYYDRHPRAKKRRLEFATAHQQIAEFLTAAPAEQTTALNAMLLNNNPQNTGQCVQYLRTRSAQTTYVFRGCDLDGRHPFEEARLEIWAPEEDTADYFGSLRPMALGIVSSPRGRARSSVALPIPPSGVDAGAFYDLVDARRRGLSDNLLTIDRAANDTSVVFCLEWRGWQLLFPGDAEHRSWKMMHAHGLLKPVHFLKVGHHGSANGTPPVDLLEKVIPRVARDDRPRRAVISTCVNTYAGVPDQVTKDELSRRCQLGSVGEVDEPAYLDLEFPG